jgi:hypothetical protein
MKTGTLTLTALIFTCPLRASVIDGPIINPANGHTYYLLSQSSWADAESQAVALGGDLVTINDRAENDWVYSTFGRNTNLWIGLEDVSGNGQFTWVSGDPSTYRNWALGEPNNIGTEVIVHMWGNEQDISLFPANRVAATWNNVAVDPPGFTPDVFGVVEVVPEPSGPLLIVVAAAVARRGLRLHQR